jgi:ATP-dependent DNA ligase
MNLAVFVAVLVGGLVQTSGLHTRSIVVVQVEYLEWTDGDHLRHSKFAGLREDKEARGVTKEHGGEVSQGG